MIATRQLCTFWLDQLYLGVDVGEVQGVVSHQPLTHIPLAPPAVRGLMNLRGDVIVGVDLRPCLGLDAARADHRWVNMILKDASGSLSLLVDRIGDVAEVAEEILEAVPETLPVKIREITDYVCRQDEKLLLLLDVAKVIHLVSGSDRDFLK